MVEQWEIAWLAAAMDGEGTISIYRHVTDKVTGSFYLTPRFTLCNMDERFVVEASRIVSGIVGEDCGGVSRSKSGCFVFSTVRKDAILMLCDVLGPYVIVKRANVVRMIAWLRDGVVPVDVPCVVRENDKLKGNRRAVDAMNANNNYLGGNRGDSEGHRRAALCVKNNHLKGNRRDPSDPDKHSRASRARWMKQRELNGMEDKR